MYTDDQWTEIDSLEREIERLEGELIECENLRSALDMDDEDYEGKCQWYDREIAEIDNELYAAVEELDWLTKGRT